jgi:hypothetical protein
VRFATGLALSEKSRRLSASVELSREEGVVLLVRDRFIEANGLARKTSII